MRHLSAESALYCRIVTEGIFGIDPTGFGTFELKPHLPKGIERMSLRNVRDLPPRIQGHCRSFSSDLYGRASWASQVVSHYERIFLRKMSA